MEKESCATADPDMALSENKSMIKDKGDEGEVKMGPK